MFSLPEQKNCCRKLGVRCRKSELDTCELANINEKGKNRCHKSAVGCRKSHTCVGTLSAVHKGSEYI